MAQFCARVRKRSDLPSVSMKDIYRHPTIKSLAAAFADPAPTLPAANPPADSLPAPTPTGSPVPATMEASPRASTGQYVCLRGAAATGLPWLRLALRGHRDPRLPLGRGRHRRPRHLPAVGPVRRRGLRQPVRPADHRQVGPRRSLEASADPRLEPGLLPLLAGQDADPDEPTRSHRGRVAVVRALSEGAGRSSRERRRDLLPDPGVHRPAHHRRRHRGP